MRVKTRSISGSERGIGRHERTHLRQDHDQRRLPQIGGFAAHVGPGDDGDQAGGGVEVEIVGDEAAGIVLRQALDHRMAAGHDAHFAVVGKARARVAILRGHLRQRRGHVQFGDGRRGGSDALRMRGGELAHFGEELLFERQDFLLGIQHLALVVLQLRRGEALGIDQRLLAFVIGGRQVHVGVRDFDVVAEDVVEADLERLDAGARAFARFDLGDVLAAVPAEIAQFVQFGVEARRG